VGQRDLAGGAACRPRHDLIKYMDKFGVDVCFASANR
jgi:hypothetical protein